MKNARALCALTLLLLTSACGGTGGKPTAAEAPGASADAPDAAAASLAPVSVDDRVECDATGCTIHFVTDRAKAELESKPGYASRAIRIGRTSDDGVLASLTKLPWVTDLKIESENITDLSPLTTLKSLTRLTVFAAVTNLAPLRTLTNLERLALIDLPLKSDGELTALAELGSLTSLTLGGLHIKSFAPVGKVTSLRTLELFDKNGISSIAFVSSLTKLTSLTIRNHPDVRDLSPVASLTQLESLSIEEIAPEASVSPLRTLTKLRKLALASTRFKDVGTVSALRSLEGLALANVPAFSDASVIAGLPKLRTLTLANVPLRTVAPLARLAKLEELTIVRTPVKDVSPLTSVRSLHVVVLGEGVSAASEAQLRKALPNARIERVHD